MQTQVSRRIGIVGNFKFPQLPRRTREIDRQMGRHLNTFAEERHAALTGLDEALTIGSDVYPRAAGGRPR
jgi:hypothetical protein